LTVLSPESRAPRSLQPHEDEAGVVAGQKLPRVGESNVLGDEQTVLRLRDGAHIWIGVTGEVPGVHVFHVMSERAKRFDQVSRKILVE
jgi:hypothetical protein